MKFREETQELSPWDRFRGRRKRKACWERLGSVGLVGKLLVVSRTEGHFAQCSKNKQLIYITEGKTMFNLLRDN